MKRFWSLFVIIYSFCPTIFAQANLPTLAEIKHNAEHGDQKAQDRLADAYYGNLDYTNAFRWYRSAAEQGIANSQYHLGKMLISQGYDFTFRKAKSAEKIGEGVKWLSLSARQRYQLAEIDLARLYNDGQFVKKDYAEAYKWFSLAHDVPGMEFLAKVERDQLILKMTQEQIDDGENRFKTFLATKGANERLPTPSFVDHLKLYGITGSRQNPLVMVNNQTFGQGEEALVKVDGRAVKVKCLQIRKNSVVIKMNGIEKEIELTLGR